jgi:hypothetical protein
MQFARGTKLQVRSRTQPSSEAAKLSLRFSSNTTSLRTKRLCLATLEVAILELRLYRNRSAGSRIIRWVGPPRRPPHLNGTADEARQDVDLE